MTTQNPIIEPTQAQPPEEGQSTFRYRRAFENRRAAIALIPDSALAALNIDVRAAVVAGIAAAPEVLALLPTIEETFRVFDRAAIVQLDERARALGYSNNRYLAAIAPAERIPEFVAKVTAAKDVLLSDIRTLQKRKLLKTDQLANLKEGVVSHRDLAFDTMVLTEILRDNWDTIKGKTGVTLEELDDAESDADELSSAIAIKEGGPSIVTEAAQTRHRAFTDFVNAHNEARHIVQYLRRHEGDADEIIPSLYAGRGGRGRRETEEPEAPATLATPAPSNGAPATPAGEEVRAPGTGLPGNRPF